MYSASVRVTVKLAFLVLYRFSPVFLACLSWTLKDEQQSAIMAIFEGQSRSVCLRAMGKS